MILILILITILLYVLYNNMNNSEHFMIGCPGQSQNISLINVLKNEENTSLLDISGNGTTIAVIVEHDIASDELNNGSIPIVDETNGKTIGFLLGFIFMIGIGAYCASPSIKKYIFKSPTIVNNDDLEGTQLDDYTTSNPINIDDLTENADLLKLTNDERNFVELHGKTAGAFLALSPRQRNQMINGIQP